MQVADLYAALGFKVDEKAWKKGDDAIKSMMTKVVALGAAWFGFSAGKKALIDFNSTVEDTRNQIAGMMALATHTDLADNYANADKTLGNLQRRAATLPGTTAEYASMLGMLTQPILDAKLSMQDLEDITVNSVVAAKALGVEAGAAARDVDQALRGQFRSTDVFTGKLLGSTGFKGEAGRTKFNALSDAQRAAALKDALTQKQITQLAEAQGNTFSGVLSTVQDALQQFFAAVGKPLFAAITAELKRWVAWLDANKDAVKAFAVTLANDLMIAWNAVATAVGVVVDVIQFLMDHSNLAMGIFAALTGVAVEFGIAAAVAWVEATWPILALIAGIAAVVASVLWLGENFDEVWDGITAAFDAIGGFFADVASSIKDAFVAVFDWIAAKINWAINAATTVAHYATHPWELAEAAGHYFSGGDGADSIDGVATAPAERSVPGQVAPVVKLNAPTTITINGNIPNDWIDTKVDRKIADHHDRVLRDADAGVAGDEP